MRFEVIATAPSEQVSDDECWGDGRRGAGEVAADTSTEGEKWITEQTAWTKTYFMW